MHDSGEDLDQGILAGSAGLGGDDGGELGRAAGEFAPELEQLEAARLGPDSGPPSGGGSCARDGGDHVLRCRDPVAAHLGAGAGIERDEVVALRGRWCRHSETVG
ncbi:hypothetical protein GCM10023147_13200 [Tsukamurella soli]|uniref:Uncharacterized protein n=1 Tax=Tsukamurella soli TaxID=644556 RepID=A0ABP8JB91_9ACTN